MNDEFYIGYLPKAPRQTACFARRRVLVATAVALLAAGGLAAILPYPGAGVFAFGRPRDFAGTVRCEGAMLPRLVAEEDDYLMVGAGKHGAPVEWCGASGTDVAVRGTLIRREGRQLIEVAGLPPDVRAPGAPAGADVPLGRFTLTGEIVDPKCYFGVMNPAEGRAHRACAVLCLRGGIPAVFVARDRAGGTAHLLLTGPGGEDITEALLPWVGEGVEAEGEVVRQGRWLVWRIEPKSLRLADR